MSSSDQAKNVLQGVFDSQRQPRRDRGEERSQHDLRDHDRQIPQYHTESPFRHNAFSNSPHLINTVGSSHPQSSRPHLRCLPPLYPPYPAGQHLSMTTPPAMRQRTAVACDYCRKRKIRCSGYQSSSDGRCQNCIRFNMQCLFYPVSSQAAFIPASVLYGHNVRAPVASPNTKHGNYDPFNGVFEPRPTFYGAHGQPLWPAGAPALSLRSYSSPTQGHLAQPYLPPVQSFSLAHAETSHARIPSFQNDRPSLKRRLPDHESDSRESRTPWSSRLESKTPLAMGETRSARHIDFGYTGFAGCAADSPTNLTTSLQPMTSQSYDDSDLSQKDNNAAPTSMTQKSLHNCLPYDDVVAHKDSKGLLPLQADTITASSSSHIGMKVHEMLDDGGDSRPWQRPRDELKPPSKKEGRRPLYESRPYTAFSKTAAQRKSW